VRHLCPICSQPIPLLARLRDSRRAICLNCRTQLSKRTSLAQIFGLFLLVWILVGVLYVGRTHLHDWWFVAGTFMTFGLAAVWVSAQAPLLAEGDKPPQKGWVLIAALLCLTVLTGAAMKALRTLLA
jgi:hypothetical protein